MQGLNVRHQVLYGKDGGMTHQFIGVPFFKFYSSFYFLLA